jgi:hypothetical protein
MDLKMDQYRLENLGLATVVVIVVVFMKKMKLYRSDHFGYARRPTPTEPSLILLATASEFSSTDGNC